MTGKNVFVTNSSEQTQKLGEVLAGELRGGEVICLSGDLGSGKTTFAQGLLKGLGAKGPYTSPTFIVLKHYRTNVSSNFKFSKINRTKKNQIKNTKFQLQNTYHIDAYRVSVRDILNLGWEEILANGKNVVIVEWAERIQGIIPNSAIWIRFEHTKDEERKISLG